MGNQAKESSLPLSSLHDALHQFALFDVFVPQAPL